MRTKPTADLELVHSFLVVAEERSFRRAAERLDIDQSALTRRIQRLEAALGFALLERTSREVAVTPAGAVFEAKNIACFEALHGATRAARLVAEGRAGVLRIGYMSFAAPRLMPEAVARFNADHPGIALQFSYRPTVDQMRALARDEVDVGYLIGPFEHDDFEVISLGSDPLCLVAARGHPLLGAPALMPEDLAGVPLVLGDHTAWEAYRARLDHLFAAKGLALSVSIEAPDTLALVGLVASGLGVTIYPKSLTRVLGDAVEARAFDAPAFDVETVLARKRVNRTAAVRAFMKHAQAVA